MSESKQEASTPLIAKCLNCNRDYDQTTQGAVCPHNVGGPNSLPPWPKMDAFAKERKEFERWIRLKWDLANDDMRQLTGGSYAVHNVNCCWIGWLGRAGGQNARST